MKKVRNYPGGVMCKFGHLWVHFLQHMRSSGKEKSMAYQVDIKGDRGHDYRDSDRNPTFSVVVILNGGYRRFGCPIGGKNDDLGHIKLVYRLFINQWLMLNVCLKFQVKSSHQSQPDTIELQLGSSCVNSETILSTIVSQLR
ncbi:hypothetical protein Hdeb2414_s0025g00659991 [Helianthus debilis subsp. tardiflorus]